MDRNATSIAFRSNCSLIGSKLGSSISTEIHCISVELQNSNRCNSTRCKSPGEIDVDTDDDDVYNFIQNKFLINFVKKTNPTRTSSRRK